MKESAEGGRSSGMEFSTFGKGRVALALLWGALAMLLTSPARAVDAWTHIGPEGGNLVRSFAISPNYGRDDTIFAGTNGEGVYKSSSGGEQWLRLGTGRYISSVAISPNYATDRVVFVGELFGGGVHKSSDGGTYSGWSQTSLGDLTVHALAISPAYVWDATVFAGVEPGPSNLGGVYRSTDGGQTWSNVGLADSTISSLGISPQFASDRTVFAGTRREGFFKSTDGGNTWTSVGNSDLNYVGAIAVSPNYAVDATVVVALYRSGLVYTSTDGGGSWSETHIADEFIRSVAISPNYASDGTIFAGAEGGVYRSADRGQTWTRSDCGGGLVVTLAVSPDYARDGVLVAEVNGGGVYKSGDEGLTWTRMSQGFDAVYVDSLAISPNYDADATIYAATGQGLYKSGNRGKTWLWLSTVPGNLVDTDLEISPDFGNDNTLFAETFGAFFRSTDGGQSWKEITPGTGLIPDGVPYGSYGSLAVSPNYAADGTLFAFGWNAADKYLMRSWNRGEFWVALGFPSSGIPCGSQLERALVVSPNFANDNTLFARSCGEWYKSDTAGLFWTKFDGVTGYLAVSPNYANDSTLFVSGELAISISVDGGMTWGVVQTGAAVGPITFSPHYATDGTVFFGAWGVYKSTDRGVSWTQIGDPPASSLAVAPNYANHSDIFAAHHGIYTYKPIITATAGAGGTIVPSGAVAVDYGGTKSFSMRPRAGYRLVDVTVDGASVGPVPSYTFYDVTTSEHTIHATFSGPDVAVAEPYHDFGNVILWRTGLRSFDLSNRGTEDLHISSLSIAGDDREMFAVATGGANPCSSLAPTLAPGAHCTVVASFTPASTGRKSALLRVSSDDPETPVLDVPLFGTGILGKTDLVIDNYGHGPNPACSGDDVLATIVIRNMGPDPSGPAKARLYLSLNARHDAGDLSLGELRMGVLEPEATTMVRILVTLPELPAGRYYLIAKADADDQVVETKESNNTWSSLLKVGPDLLVSALRFEEGDTGYNLRFDTTNQGCAAGPSTTWAYFWSSDCVLDPGDAKAGGLHVETLGRDETIPTWMNNFTVPPELPMGTYYILAKADADLEVPEYDENNNLKCLAIRVGPDLIVDAIEISPGAPRAGRPATATVTVRNQGNQAAGPFVVTFKTDVLDLSHAYDFSCAKAGLASGASDTCVGTVVYSKPSTSSAAADAGNQVVELVENNNTRTKAVNVR